MDQAISQATLEQHQIEAFYVDCFVESQVAHFIELTASLPASGKQYIVDMGGGVGYFARELQQKTGLSIRVIDSDQQSIASVQALHNPHILGVIGDALHPYTQGDERIICFNLILHHLIGKNERETRVLQKQALTAWHGKADYLFVHEYIYESFFANISGRLIYEITRNKVLSLLGTLLGKIIPAFRANTFGVGVRFRAHNEWISLFEECGYRVVSKAYGEVEYTALPLRLLFIRQVRRDSYVLAKI
jgi:hypothetical protein